MSQLHVDELAESSKESSRALIQCRSRSRLRAIDGLPSFSCDRSRGEIIFASSVAVIITGMLLVDRGKRWHKASIVGARTDHSLGLTGLIAGGGISVVMISVPDFIGSGPQAIVQLLGPNVTTVTGAALGAVIGRFVPRPIESRYARAGGIR